MAQQKLNRGGTPEDSLAAIDANFDDLFDLMQILYVDFNFLATVAAQPLFNASPNGALSLLPGLYEFECSFDMTGMSTTSGTFGFALGGTATLDSQKWQSTANKATRGTQANGQSTYNSAANTALTANTTTAEGWAYICGVFRVSAAGTLIPQVSFSTITGGPIVAVKQNSFFRVKKLNQVYRATRIAPPAAPGPLTPQWS